MKLVPTVVNGEDGRPVHHGVVERAYDRLRFCVQRYVVDKQEDCIATVCLLCVVRCNAIIRTSSMCVHECVCVYVPLSRGDLLRRGIRCRYRQ